MKKTPTGAAPPSERELIAAIRTGIAYVERGNYKQGYKALQVAYTSRIESLPSDGLSHFGLCIALIEKQTRKGAELCRIAIEDQFFNSIHFVNLVHLYVLRGNRKAAVEILHEGLTRLPNDSSLLEVREEIGYRKAPVVAFLHRNNPLNSALGRLRATKAPKKTPDR